jgi:hypothetical protein
MFSARGGAPHAWSTSHPRTVDAPTSAGVPSGASSTTSTEKRRCTWVEPGNSVSIASPNRARRPGGPATSSGCCPAGELAVEDEEGQAAAIRAGGGDPVGAGGCQSLLGPGPWQYGLAGSRLCVRLVPIWHPRAGRRDGVGWGAHGVPLPGMAEAVAPAGRFAGGTDQPSGHRRDLGSGAGDRHRRSVAGPRPGPIGRGTGTGAARAFVDGSGPAHPGASPPAPRPAVFGSVTRCLARPAERGLALSVGEPCTARQGQS